MKYEYENEIKIPLEEKTFILPQPRIKLFQNLLENYKIFCPEIKLIYSYLNFNSKYPNDYLVIFVGSSNGERVILWDAPYLYSNKTVPAYSYICKNHLFDQFFKFAIQSLCTMQYDKFIEFLQSPICNLSLDPKAPNYWKSPDNAEILLENMSELSLQYTPTPGQTGVRIIPHKKDLKR